MGASMACDKSAVITILGSCSGTEPILGSHHVSFTIESEDMLYWFDAGESCSYTAQTLGIDLLKSKVICISHAHLDHVGGIANLLWTIRKLDTLAKENRKITGKEIFIIHPNIRSWYATIDLLKESEMGFEIDFLLKHIAPNDSIIYTDENIQITGLHNSHLPYDANARNWLSYSYQILIKGKKIVYSGDVNSISELEPLLSDVDILLMETGHHQVDGVCKYVKSLGDKVKSLVFIHHGRAILNDFHGEYEKAHLILGNVVTFAKDRMKILI
jgi:ribonuclease BN (tRNA processing enzyme)